VGLPSSSPRAGHAWRHTSTCGGLELNRLKRFLLIGAIVLVFVAVDRVTKGLAQHTLSQSEHRSLAGGVLTLTYAENYGAFLGLGSSLPSSVRFALSLLANAVIIAWGLVMIVRTASIGLYRLICVALLVGGGIGNLIDRLQNDGAVIDFMILRVGPLQTGVFNVADIAITGGALALATLAFCEARQSHQQQVAEPTEEDGEPAHPTAREGRNGRRL
jgi:signal peptidase II